MPVDTQDTMSVFVVNVGQADTSVIRTPGGKIIIIDAVIPYKLRDLLGKIGLDPGDEIDELIITHPHRDHYTAANSLFEHYSVKSVTLSPFWHEKGWGSNQYKTIVNRIEATRVPVRFLSGYSRIYPDDFIDDPPAGDPVVHRDRPYLEVLGPSNGLVTKLEGKEGYGVNHLSIMVRLTWGSFTMVFAADAQMENWSHFDSEGMLESRCKVLKAAHHGSKRGTQWERLERLQPRCVIVSSEPSTGHNIPDLIGSAVFKEYNDDSSNPLVVVTEYTGTVEIVISPSYRQSYYQFRESKDDLIPYGNGLRLRASNNPTDWEQVLEARMEHPHGG